MLFKFLFGKQNEKYAVESIIDKVSKEASCRISEHVVSAKVSDAETKKLSNEEAKIDIEKRKLEIEKHKVIRQQQVDSYLSCLKIDTKMPGHLNELNTEEIKLIWNHTIEGNKLTVARESSRIAANATLKAAGIRGFFAIASTAIVTGTAYYYFKPIETESNRLKEELDLYKNHFFTAHTDAMHKRKILDELKKGEGNYIADKDLPRFEKYLESKNSEYVKDISRIPQEQAYKKLKAKI